MTEHSYQDLPPHVKKFLEGLDEDDVAFALKGIKLARGAETVGRFWKWTAITILAVFTGAAAFGQSVEWLWARIFRGDS